ncbi:unnamed protein product [Sphacelaria rigidula]
MSNELLPRPLLGISAAIMKSTQPSVALEKALDAARDNPRTSASIAAVAGVSMIYVLFFTKRQTKRDGMDYKSMSGVTHVLNNTESVLPKDDVKDAIDGYEELFAGARKEHGAITTEESIKKRQTEYQKMVNSFYNLVTDFYEWGWGQSFHFAPRRKGETFHESILRAEYVLASRIEVRPGSKVLDVGCGVGGPMRNIAVFGDCDITGITINQYQVNVGNKYNGEAGLGDRCRSTQGDFQSLPFSAAQFDAAYQIEATCHSPDKVQVFREVCRVLKQGGMFGGYEWVVTDKYDASNPDHVRLKEGIEVGNGLPTLATPAIIKANLEEAGFEVVYAYNANETTHDAMEVPWYQTLCGSFSLSGFRMTRLGRVCTHGLVSTLETLRIAPRGSAQVSTLLNKTAIDIVDAGKLEIFTPSYFFAARKK